MRWHAPAWKSSAREFFTGDSRDPCELFAPTDMEILDFFLAAAVILLAYLVRGISGFGSALVAVPLLAHFLPLTFVVPWVVVMDTLAALLLARSGQRGGHVRWDEIGWLLPAALLGIVAGILLLVNLDPEPLLVALGLFVAGFGVRNLLGLHGEQPVSRWWALPAGILGGSIGALFATGGPPMVIYLNHRLCDKTALRATLSGLFLIEGSLRVAGLGVAGLLLQPQMGWYLLAGVPLMLAGLAIGNHVHLNLGQRQMTIAIALLLIGSGVSLLWRVSLQL
jgi:uncharacterized membrane protein YfcA